MDRLEQAANVLDSRLRGGMDCSYCGMGLFDRDSRTEHEPDCAVLTLREAALAIAQLKAERDTRHYVCDAHVPLGDSPHDAACPCCEAVSQNDKLLKALANIEALTKR